MKGRFTLIFFIFCIFLFPAALSAQDIKVSGKVTDQTDGGPLPGVTVSVEGMSRATLTDNSGNFVISAPSGGKLVFKLIGMTPKTIQITGSAMNVTLAQDTKALSEVVVVGYGTQKKSVVTGAISGVKAADLENQPVTRVEQALQGRTSGLTIASTSGSPGAASTIRLRGFTSFGNNDNSKNNPLWVVDGIVVDNGGIGYLNQSDIESIEVLKDAASAAIYGARSAAGVILVTTKKGKEGTVRINYSAYYGTSSPAKRLDLLNATQYATVRDAAATAAGNAAPYPNPSSYGVGTNWQDVVFNDDARKQNHELSMSGGNEKSTYYTSFGYSDINGIVATPISTWKRFNVRLNSTTKLAKWLTFGENLGYSYTKSTSVGATNREFGGPLSSAVNLSPMTPVVVTDINSVPDKNLYANQNIVRDANGNPYGIPGAGFQEMTNPLAYIKTHLGNYNWSHDIVGNAYVEASPIPGLKLRSTIGTKMSFYGNDAFTPLAYFSTSSSNTTNNFYREIDYSLAYTQENTASYSKDFGKHNISFLVGEGYYRDNYTRGVNATFYNIPATSFEQASLNYKPIPVNRIADGTDGTDHIVNSLFSRLQYNYDEKYLFTALVRRDGSSRFGANHKFGYFPSFSVGWVPTREDFIPKNDVLTFMKIRASYGVTGNDVIGDFSYVPLVNSGYNYPFGVGTGESINVGYAPAAAANPDLKWEQTTQTDIGIDATLFQNLTLTADWYKKKTTGILQYPPIPAYVGYGSSAQNAADMQNTGIEFEVGYHKKFGEISLGLNANASFLKNKVTKLLPNINYIEDGTAAFQTLGNITRTEIGRSYNEFYGYKYLGIFQSQAEINAYKGPNGTILQPNAKPGDVKFANLNNDESINADDRTYIGNPTPKMTYGLTINVGYKNFDLVAFGSGVAGNKIFQGLRRLDIANANYQTDILNSWSSTNTNTNLPRLIDGDPNGNYSKFSSLYLQSGNYFRLRTLQLGYTFPKTATDKMKMQKLRIYIMSENLFTITKYTGYDPELGVSNDAGGGGVFSVDRGAYPQARSFLIGLNVGF